MRRSVAVLTLAVAVGCGGGGGSPTPRITVTSPNGSETWIMGEARDITWSSVELTANVDIHYTTDSTAVPVVWTEIVADVADSGTQSWTVPTADSANCLVRVQETGGGGLTDESDADFTITFPKIVVTSPDGGEVWYYQGSRHDITWTSVGVGGNVDIHYTIDSTAGPVQWLVIATNVANSGSREWPIPDQNSANCRVRVQETGGGGLADQSGSDFTIAQPPSVGFTEYADLTGVREASLAWGDYDGDGDLDLLVAGYDGSLASTTIYKYDAGAFSVETSAILSGIRLGAAAWADYDNDGDLDIALVGADTVLNPAGRLYSNVGGGNYLNAPFAPLLAVAESCLAWGDYDNNGFVDIEHTGVASGSSLRNRLSQNFGGGSFVPVDLALNGVPAVYRGSVAWADYDNDGDLDLALAGASTFTPADPVAGVYANNGDGTFTEDSDAILTPVYECSLAWGDYDNDGDLDLALAGWDENTSAPVSKLYENDAGSFTDVSPALTGVHCCSLAWGDCDNDGDLDLVLAGYDSTSTAVTKLYRNNGGGLFVEVATSFAGVYECSLAWGDYDADGRLDLALAGTTDGTDRLTKVYRNGLATSNAAPSAPTGLLASVSGDEVTFSWEAASDTETRSMGLSYNVRVGTANDDDDVFAGTADLASGLGLLPALGNAQQNLSWTLKGLDSDTYYWSVQAVDSGFRRSAWAAEEIVTVP